jgi:hypothetical protein
MTRHRKPGDALSFISGLAYAQPASYSTCLPAVAAGMYSAILIDQAPGTEISSG